MGARDLGQVSHVSGDADESTATAVLTSWTLVTGTTYRSDFVHNLDTDLLSYSIVDTATEKMVRVEDVEVIDTNTLRVFTEGNGHSLRISAVSGGSGTGSGSTTATALATTGADVGIDAAAPPTTGQVLKATSPTTATWQDEAGGPSGDITIVEKTANYQLLAADSGSLFTNRGDAGVQTLTCPAVTGPTLATGWNITVRRLASFALRVAPKATENIRYSAGALAVNKYLECGSDEATFRIIWDGTEFLVDQENGTLNAES